MKATLATMIGLFALVVAGGARAEALVTLRSAAELQGPAVRLSDVFDGVPHERDREIALAPAPGKSVTYNVRVLGRLAQQNGLSWQAQGLADHIVLTRAATRITPDMIREAVLQKIKESDPAIDGAIEVLFDNKNLGLSLPSEQQAAFDLTNFDYDSQNRRFRSELVAQTGGQPVRQTVAGRVVVKRSVPVLARRLLAGDIIQEQDLRWVEANDDRLGTDVLTRVEQIVGLEARHPHGEGEVIRARDVVPPRLVKRGSLVTMVVETPYMSITAQGRALQDGAKNSLVRLTNLQSNRVVEGVVEADGLVRIVPAQKLASAE